MFVANVLTVWGEALKALFSDNHPNEDLRGLPVNTEYPLREIDYPGVWLNFLIQGDVRNVGIDHREYYLDDDGFHEVFRWHFSGAIEITIGAMGNLERALLLDEISKDIAVGRVDGNPYGELRRVVEHSDLLGQNVTWESFTITGMAETPGTPWQTDDVIYEATIMLNVEGEVVLDPKTQALIPLSAIVVNPMLEDDPDLPAPYEEGWR